MTKWQTVERINEKTSEWQITKREEREASKTKYQLIKINTTDISK